MKNKLKKLLIISCVLMMSVTGLVALNVSATGNENIITHPLTSESIELPGASIRLKNDGRNGIRFPVRIEKNIFEENVKEGTLTGTLIIPKSIYDEKQYTIDSLTVPVANLPDSKIKNINTSDMWYKINTGGNSFADESDYSAYQSMIYVYNIDEFNYDNSFYVRGYVKIGDDYIYSAVLSDRSLSYVSDKALDSGTYHYGTEDYITLSEYSSKNVLSINPFLASSEEYDIALKECNNFFDTKWIYTYANGNMTENSIFNLEIPVEIVNKLINAGFNQYKIIFTGLGNSATSFTVSDIIQNQEGGSINKVLTKDTPSIIENINIKNNSFNSFEISIIHYKTFDKDNIESYIKLNYDYTYDNGTFTYNYDPGIPFEMELTPVAFDYVTKNHEDLVACFNGGCIFSISVNDKIVASDFSEAFISAPFIYKLSDLTSDKIVVKQENNSTPITVNMTFGFSEKYNRDDISTYFSTDLTLIKDNDNIKIQSKNSIGNMYHIISVKKEFIDQIKKTGADNLVLNFSGTSNINLGKLSEGIMSCKASTSLTISDLKNTNDNVDILFGTDDNTQPVIMTFSYN